MEAPLISVIIPYYNGQRFIAETLGSVFRQNYSNLEILIVNDGSSDESLRALDPFADRIVLISQENQGQAAARNTGLAHAKGSLVTFLDQDDLWPDDHLALLLPHVTGPHPYDYAQGVIQEFRTNADGSLETGEPYLHRVILGSALFGTRVFERAGTFDASIHEGEDFDFAIRVEESGCTVMRVPNVTLMYRRHESNYSNTKDFVQKGEFLSIRKKLQRARERAAENL